MSLIPGLKGINSFFDWEEHKWRFLWGFIWRDSIGASSAGHRTSCSWSKTGSFRDEPGRSRLVETSSWMSVTIVLGFAVCDIFLAKILISRAIILDLRFLTVIYCDSPGRHLAATWLFERPIGRVIISANAEWSDNFWATKNKLYILAIN